MRAYVDYRRGSIFDGACDVLVIPCSVGGTVTPEMQQEIRDTGLPLPEAMKLGDVLLLPSENVHYRTVAYAAALAGDQTSSEALVEGIGSKLGWIAESQGYTRFSAPDFGADSGDLSAPVAAAALARGFQSTAPESAELYISVRDRERLRAVATRLLGVVPSAPDTTEKVYRRVQDILADSHRPVLYGHEEVPPPVASAPPLAPATIGRKGVFISYSHADAWWLERLQKHLKPLQREGVEVWDDTRLKAGEQWREEIRQALTSTKVAILLISADFMASDFIDKNELPPLLQAAEEDGATILPVIINHCRFVRTPSLSRFQAVNDPAKPLAQMSLANREKVLDDVASAVEDALNR